MGKPMYKKGKRIESVEELATCKYVYIFGDRPTHIGFVLSLQLRTVLLAIKRGTYRAEENDG